MSVVSVEEAFMAPVFASRRGPTRAEMEAVESMIGKRCVVSWNIPGVVVGVNTTRGSLYSGDRFPLLVKQDATGKVFEYGFDGFSLVEE